MIKFLYLFITLLLSHSLFSQTLENDRLALIDLYNSTNGSNWTNKTGWNVPGTLGDNPFSSYGVSCSEGRVTSVNLYNNNLAGNLPATIGNLSKLQYFSLSTNQLSGSIPAAIGNLSNLQSLELRFNYLFLLGLLFRKFVYGI